MGYFCGKTVDLTFIKFTGFINNLSWELLWSSNMNLNIHFLRPSTLVKISKHYTISKHGDSIWDCEETVEKYWLSLGSKLINVIDSLNAESHIWLCTDSTLIYYQDFHLTTSFNQKLQYLHSKSLFFWIHHNCLKFISI